jgi:hypothetical protein
MTCTIIAKTLYYDNRYLVDLKWIILLDDFESSKILSKTFSSGWLLYLVTRYGDVMNGVTSYVWTCWESWHWDDMSNLCAKAKHQSLDTTMERKNMSH